MFRVILGDVPRAGIGHFLVNCLKFIQANDFSHGLRVMSEALRLKADEGAPNATNNARKSSATLAFTLLVL
jgi:hypothetical protein